MPRFALPLLAWLAACASQTSSAPAPATQTVRVAGPGGAQKFETSTASLARRDTIWLDLDRVWKVLPDVYNALNIPIDVFNAESNTMGNEGMKLYRRLGNVPLTRYLDCGRTQVDQNADTYEVHMSVLTSLTKGPDGTTLVHTTLDASARPIQFAGGHVRCTSKRALEARIAEVLKVRLEP